MLPVLWSEPPPKPYDCSHWFSCHSLGFCSTIPVSLYFDKQGPMFATELTSSYCFLPVRIGTTKPLLFGTASLPLSPNLKFLQNLMGSLCIKLYCNLEDTYQKQKSLQAVLFFVGLRVKVQWGNILEVLRNLIFYQRGLRGMSLWFLEAVFLPQWCKKMVHRPNPTHTLFWLGLQASNSF